MVRLCTRPSRRSDADEASIMITVVLMGLILALMMAAIAARSVSDQNQVSGQRLWEQSLHVAESGVDHTLRQLLADRNFVTSGTSGQDANLPSSFSSHAEEEAFVRGVVTDNPTVKLREGEWSIYKPAEVRVVYGVGYVPSKAVARRSRLVRVEYDFPSFAPNAAILTGGDLYIAGNPSILGANGNAHANGNVTITGGSVEITGYVSAAGNYSVSNSTKIGDPANSGGGMPPRDVPHIDPSENYHASQYDLCPNGSVRTGPAYLDTNGPLAPNPNSTLTPCSGDFLADAVSNEYLGWKKAGTTVIDGAKWDYAGSTAYDGVYYIYRGSAKISGNPGTDIDPWDVTILAESAVPSPGTGHCHHHVGGDVQVSGNPRVRAHSSIAPLLFVAGRDIEISGVPGAGGPNYQGVVAAHEQFKLNGNPTYYGAIIANDECDTPGSPVDSGTVEISGNPTIQYDDSIEIPLGKFIRIIHWQEL